MKMDLGEAGGFLLVLESDLRKYPVCIVLCVCVRVGVLECT